MRPFSVVGTSRACVEAVEATRAQVVHHATREVLGGFEGHVLEVMGKAILLVILEDSSDIL